MRLNRVHLILALTALPAIGFSLACHGTAHGSEDFIGGDGSWAVVGGTCVNTLTPGTADTHMQITRTTIRSSAGYADYGTATAWGISRDLNFTSGSVSNSAWNGTRDPSGESFTLRIKDDGSGSTSASDCQAAYGTITWIFDDADAPSLAPMAPSGPGGVPEELCDPGETEHDSERKLTAVPGSPSRIPLAVAEDRTDAGALLSRVEILDFAGATEIGFDSPQGWIALTPADPVAEVQMAAAELVFRTEGIEPDQAPRALVRTSCQAPFQTVELPTGYRIDSQWLGLADPDLAQALVARIVEGESGPYLLTTARGALVGSTIALEPIGPDAYRIDDPRVDGDVQLQVGSDGLGVSGWSHGAPVDLTFPIHF